MRNDDSQRFEKFTGNGSFIDLPHAGQCVYDESICFAGWVFASERDASRCRVRAWLDHEVIGETRVLFSRSDVSNHLSIPHDAPTSFRFLGRVGQPLDAPRDAVVQLSVSWLGDSTEYELGQVAVHLVPAEIERRPHGEVLFPAQRMLLHRHDIYGSGPPLLQPGEELVRLISDYLSPGSSVVDVGCGAGAYGPPLIKRGHRWTGLEVNPDCLAMLQSRGLPFRKLEPGQSRFPCEDREFDEAICIEVLEHIEPPDPFVQEISRIVRKRALFSVPNLEVIPYFKDWEAVPWHILEGDHKNFFTRTNLRELLARHFPQIEVFSCIEHPLRTRAGVPLHVHLFAVADKTG